MIRLLSLALAFMALLIGAVFMINALMVTFDTIFAARDATIALTFGVLALVILKAGELLQFAWDDWDTRKMQTALRRMNGHVPTSIIQNQNWVSSYSEPDTQELPRVG